MYTLVPALVPPERNQLPRHASNVCPRPRALGVEVPVDEARVQTVTVMGEPVDMRFIPRRLSPAYHIFYLQTISSPRTPPPGPITTYQCACCRCTPCLWSIASTKCNFPSLKASRLTSSRLRAIDPANAVQPWHRDSAQRRWHVANGSIDHALQEIALHKQTPSKLRGIVKDKEKDIEVRGCGAGELTHDSSSENTLCHDVISGTRAKMGEARVNSVLTQRKRLCRL